MEVQAHPHHNQEINTNRTFETRKKALKNGAIAGAIFPYGLRLIFAIKGISQPIEFVPHFLAFFVGRAVIPQTVLLIYDTGLSILGDREAVENQDSSQTRSRSGFLRQWSWCIIGKGEQVVNSIDSFSSRILGIRTSKVINENKIEYSNLRYIEIFRSVVLKEIEYTVTTVLPMLVTVSLIRAAGYTVFGGVAFGIENRNWIMIQIAIRWMRHVAHLQNVEPELAVF